MRSLETFRQSEQPKISKFELDPTSQQNLTDFEQWLAPNLGPEAAAQLAFVMQTMAAEDFTNQCHEATAELGRRLCQHFGDEESFADLIKTDYSDVTSKGPLSKLGYNGQHHTIGLLECQPVNAEALAIAIDLNFGEVSGRHNQGAALALTANDRRELLEKLDNIYGGHWEIGCRLDQKTGKYIFENKL